MAILIVDDIPVNLMLLEEMLQQEGYADIYCVRSGQEALEILETSEEAEEKRIDLVLMDVMMPGMDGIETCQRIKAQDGQRKKRKRTKSRACLKKRSCQQKTMQISLRTARQSEAIFFAQWARISPSSRRYYHQAP